MGVKLRPARPADALALVEVKRHLRMQPDTGPTQQGGFLLGTSLEQYQHFIAHDDVWVAEEEGVERVVGFSIVLSHESVVGSELWQKAARAQWAGSFLSQIGQRRVAYYEQLAFLPSPAYRVYAKYLALSSVQRAFAHHASLFTTIIRRPIRNEAALPFLRVAGFEQVGCIDEDYPPYGRVTSDIYHLDRVVFAAKTKKGFLANFVAQARCRGYPTMIEKGV